MARLFDAYLIVDWSAASKPATGANSIWIGVLAQNARLKMTFTAVNPDTRMKARDFIVGMVDKLAGRGDRVFVGFDFAMGFPVGTAAALGLDTEAAPAWRALHGLLADRMKDKADNANNRFALAASLNYAISKGPFPFWGATSKKFVTNSLSDKKSAFPQHGLDEHREAERFLRDAKRGQPKSVWQLAYVGSVGGQTLTGLPYVRALREKLPNARLWPFETGLNPLDEDALDGVQTLIAEVYPSLLDVKPKKGEPLDQAQVRDLAWAFSEADEAGRLGPAFGPPPALDPSKIPSIEAEEGWILAL